MSTYKEEVDRLADYLMEAWPHEIGQGDPAHGESAVDVAIRLLKRLEAYDASSQTQKPAVGE
jgi:hypothetical protein